ncbi:MAG: AAA family ATPase, partial [Myxococcales bacterium]
MAVDSTELVRVIAEAEDIASSVGQKLTTVHLLLAAFTVPNRAQILLSERGINEDTLLEALTRAPKEPEHLTREVLDRSREIAQGCGSRETDCGHMLIATTRTRDCLALKLLIACGVDVSSLRNTVLSYYLGGHMPRRLTNVDRATMPPPSPTSLRSWPHARPVSAPAPTIAPTVPLPEPLVEPRLEPEPEPARRAETRPEPRIESRIESILPEPVASPEPAPRPKAASTSSFALSEKEYPTLCSLGRNLTELAALGRIDPVIGREREIDEVIDILGKRRTNNPCLLGEPGVGKTAVVEGVASKLVELAARGVGERVIVELDMASLVAGTQLRGSFSEKLNQVKDEVRKANGRIVVFIDEIHTLIGAGSTGEGPQDAANELKSALARGDFPCIGATTHDEYRKFIEQDPALERRFTVVHINEPTVAQTVEILSGIIARYEEHHGVRYEPQALEAAASFASKYVSDRFLPDKAISIIDLAGSRARREG